MHIDHEKQLVEKAKESLQAFDELYDYYLPKIYSYVINRIANKEIAEDITSKTFIKAMTKIQKFEYRGYTFGAWLYKIAHNNMIDYFRKNKQVMIDIEKVENKLSVKSETNDIERQTIILNALKDLPEQYQEILSLKFFEELTNEEIAVVLGCSKNSVAVRSHRGLRAMEKVLQKQGYMNLLGEY